MKPFIQAVSIAVSLLAAAPTKADSPFQTYDLSMSFPGLYVHAMYAQARASDWCGGSSAQCDDTGSAYGGGLGYEFNDWVALEAAYLGIDKLTSIISGFLVSADANLIMLTAVGTFPLTDQLAVQARVGATRWEVDAEVQGSGLRYKTSVEGTSPVFGAGFLLNVTPRVALRLEYIHINEIGDRAITGESNSDSIGLGIQFKF